MELKVKIKNVYGNDVVYPVCEQSQLFTALTNKKTLTERDISVIKRLGYTFTVVTETL